MNSAYQRGLWLWGGLLAALLCLLFLPLTPGQRGAAILLVAILTIAGLVMSGRRPEGTETDGVSLADLPAAPYRLPVVLVCGDTANWPGEHNVYRTAQGCWLRVQEAALQQTVRQLRWQRPELVSQLAVMACIHPQQHDDLNALTGRLLILRWQMVQIRRDTGHQMPLILAGAIAGQAVTTPAWQSVQPGEELQLWLEGEAPQNAGTWTMQGGTPHLRTQILFSAHARFVRDIVISVLTGDNPDMAAVTPSMVLYRQTAHFSEQLTPSLWQQFLARCTTLSHVAGWESSRDNTASDKNPLPEFILPLLPQGLGSTPRSRMLRRACCFFMLAVLVALASSARDNRQLLHRISFDIAQYNRIAMTDHFPKAKAVATLRTDATLLNDWWRNGEPLRYGLGLYRGELLRPAVLAAIQSYVPPPPPPAPVIKNIIHTTGPQAVRLDSLSLFDTGKWQLKPGSTKVLVNALVGIKAKPGWLIVVSGHTDNTGNPQLNQTLSLKRAESVRDWMRDTGDVPESCFAVQGYGESRPVASNDTPDGRARNRRVEISLVPQADACQVPEPHQVATTGDINKK